MISRFPILVRQSFDLVFGAEEGRTTICSLRGCGIQSKSYLATNSHAYHTRVEEELHRVVLLMCVLCRILVELYML